VEPIRWEEKDGCRFIHLAGELDLDVCRRIEPEFRRAVGNGECDVAVTLDDVSFMASRALGLLILAHQVLRESGRRLRLSGQRPMIQKTLDAVGFTKLLEME